jgi:ABC-type transporter Mla subunit MlaD
MGLATMILATSQAVTKDIGLIAVFGGIGLLVNIILVFIAIQIRGERRENQEYMASRRSSNGA